MTVARVLDELRRHGVTAYRLDAEHVRLVPRAAVTPELAELVRQAKPKLLPLLPPVPFDYHASPYADLFIDLTGDIGTAADLRALAWAEANGWSDVITTLLAADRRCEQLAAADDEPGFRHFVARLIALFQALRAVHAAHLEAQ